MNNEKHKYQISRASSYYYAKPLDDSRVYKEEVVSEINGHKFDRWFIDLTPNELLELCESINTPLIIEPNDGTFEKYWSITIYDDYVE